MIRPQNGDRLNVITNSMKLSHINISGMLKGGEDIARSFYSGHLGLAGDSQAPSRFEFEAACGLTPADSIFIYP